MHIEVWEGDGSTLESVAADMVMRRGVKNRQFWFWHFKARNGRIVSDAESFPTKAHAVRAAKACVRAVCKCDAGDLEWTAAEKDGRLILRWA